MKLFQNFSFWESFLRVFRKKRQFDAFSITFFKTNRVLEKVYILAFFLTFLFFLVFPPFVREASAADSGFPVIQRLDTRDANFRQLIGDVQNNRRLVSASRRSLGRSISPHELAEFLTIYQYTPQLGEDIFFLAARTNIPYSALVSLNRLSSPASLEAGRPILLPTSPGIFIPNNLESDLEQLLAGSRLPCETAVELRINLRNSSSFYFFPGEDFTATERAFFLNARFRFPLRYTRITSGFGYRENPVTGNIVKHRGLDFAAPEGAEVFATADGVVTEIGYHSIYGNFIVISHTGGWTSLYGHLLTIETTLRANVRSGTLIGRVGSTGQSTGPHLHFELRQDGRHVNPAGRLRR